MKRPLRLYYVEIVILYQLLASCLYLYEGILLTLSIVLFSIIVFFMEKIYDYDMKHNVLIPTKE